MTEQDSSYLKSKGLINKMDQQRDWSFQYPSVFAEIGIPEGITLDIGAGDAKYSIWVKENGLDRGVVSFDIRELQAIDGEDMVRGSADSLPFQNNSFDSVVALFTVPSLMGDRISEKKVMEEMLRVAKKKIVIWPVPTRWFRADWETMSVFDQPTKQEMEENSRRYLKTVLGPKTELNYSFFHFVDKNAPSFLDIFLKFGKINQETHDKFLTLETEHVLVIDKLQSS